jgi:hypothetical protein
MMWKPVLRYQVLAKENIRAILLFRRAMVIKYPRNGWQLPEYPFSLLNASGGVGFLDALYTRLWRHK